MSATELLNVLRARPFQPFRMVQGDGTIYEVRHPELVIVATTTAVVGYPDPNVPGAAGRFDIVSLRHILRIEFLGQTESEEAAAGA
jgi:hypothetical protein